jgi:hypothetical protein
MVGSVLSLPFHYIVQSGTIVLLVGSTRKEIYSSASPAVLKARQILTGLHSIMDPRLRFLKEKRMVESRLQLWSVIHSNQTGNYPLDPAHMWICTEPIRPAKTTSKYDLRRRFELLFSKLACHQKPRSLDQIRKPRAQSCAWEKTRDDRLFQKRFFSLPGEVRNQIYDELLVDQVVKLETPLFRSYTNGNTHHGGAQFRGAVRLPVSSRQSLRFVRQNDPIWNELFDRWCAQVRFYLFEAFELHPQSSQLNIRRRRGKKPSVLLSRYLDTDASQVFGSSSSWFAGMRTCTLSLSLFNIAALLESGSRGIHALRAEMVEVARVLRTAEKIISLHINIRLWPRKYKDQSNGETVKLWPTMISGEGVFKCLQPLQEVAGVERICLFAGSLMAGYWDPPVTDGVVKEWNIVRNMPDHMEGIL